MTKNYLLSDAQIEFFKCNGYLIIENIITEDIIKTWEGELTEYSERCINGNGSEVIGRFKFSEGIGVHQQEKVIQIVGQLGGGSFKGGTEQLIIKRPTPSTTWSKPKLAHIDSVPQNCNWRFMMGYTVYGTETKKNGGCFLFWPGSHIRIWEHLRTHPEHYYANSKIDVDELNLIYQNINNTEPIQFEARPDTVMFWHSFLLHNGSTNCSDKPRFGIFGRWGQTMAEGESRETFGNMWENWNI